MRLAAAHTQGTARPSRPQPVHAVQGWRSKQQQLSQQQQQQQQLQRHLGLQLAGVVASLVLCSSATAVPADVFATKCAGGVITITGRRFTACSCTVYSTCTVT
eukprot:GHRQ01027706.1.p2 GENE.GHRQ01027706.1~~GHRQ01027706.1.p2  ORF type:complete len:103 (+),score=41.32 GHRQ01027706.1:1667-1975(+)